MIKKKLKVIKWAINLAYVISSKTIIISFILIIALSIFPVLALKLNQIIISQLVDYISFKKINIKEIYINIVYLGIVFSIIGVSTKINSEFLYIVLYEKYYLGMQKLLMDSINELKFDNFLNKEIKDEINAIIKRAGSLNDFISSILSLLFKFLSFFFQVLILYSISIKLFFIVITLLFVIMYCNVTSLKNEREKCMDIRENERNSIYLQQLPSCQNISKEIRIFNSKNKIISQWEREYKKIEDYEKKQNMNIEIKTYLSSLSLHLIIACINLYGIYEVIKKNMTIDIFFTLFILYQGLIYLISEIAKTFVKADHSLFALERQKKIIDNLKSTKEVASIATAPNSDIIIEAQNLSFKYNQNIILKNLNFKIKKGEIIALIGENGSGKTTLTKLILGLYSPSKGILKFNNTCYSLYSSSYILTKIAIYLQDNYIFHATIGENIGFGNISKISDYDLIISSLDKSGGLDILNKMPKGLHTWLKRDVEQEGITLSGGEEQRVGIARLLMSNKELYIFDEPGASLDPIAEVEQLLSIRNNLQGKTIIFITHRIGLAKLANRIFVLDNGELIEEGTHEELFKQEGKYAQFYLQQSSWYN